MEEKLKLKNCPFCDSSILTVLKRCVMCAGCGAQSGWVDNYDEDYAVEEHWNRRASD